jgi:hypothetical protein
MGPRIPEQAAPGAGKTLQQIRTPRAPSRRRWSCCKGAKAILTQAGVSHDLHAKVGQTAETIVSFARDYHCQLIVLGTRGMGAVATFMIGSVANRVVHQTDLPVLLVK